MRGPRGWKHERLAEVLLVLAIRRLPEHADFLFVAPAPWGPCFHYVDPETQNAIHTSHRELTTEAWGSIDHGYGAMPETRALTLESMVKKG